MNLRLPRLAVALLVLSTVRLPAREAVRPDEIQFRRQAVKRMVFDADQRITLAALQPANVIDWDLMHPEMQPESSATWSPRGSHLVAAAAGVPAVTQRWVGGFSPFATYELVIAGGKGSGAAGLVFAHRNNGDRLTAALVFADGKPEAVTWTVVVGGAEVAAERWVVPEGTELAGLTVRVQLAAVGVNLFLETTGRSQLIGVADFSRQIDLRERRRYQAMDFQVRAELKAGAELTLAGAWAGYTPGAGQADIRAITDEEGAPLLDEGRLWFTMTLRGRALPHPLQGVFSLDPSVFDLRFEGVILFDLNDGLLRNEVASHVFRDGKSGEWRGWTTGFSALDGAGRAERKTILAIRSGRDPRRGFSIMQARPIGLAGAHEDPHGVFDRQAGKWRLLLCEHGPKYRAGLWESERWDGGYVRLAGPVDMDSTGTLIQQFGGERYVLFGSADRRIYIRRYPDLGPAGELRIDLPPWNDRTGTRIWPNVIPLPAGYPAPYIALMMDRVNVPGMPRPNWTYGALYLYHGHPVAP